MNLPGGTITFLFTDIEGSTRLWEENPDGMRLALARHDALLKAAIESHGGVVFKTMGDAFCAAFSIASQAVDAALAGQLSIADWGSPNNPKSEIPNPQLKVRMALHTGEAEV